MALVQCEECGKQISTTVAQCPHCGADSQGGSDTFTKVAIGLAVAATVGVILLFAVILFNREGEATTTSDTKGPTAPAPTTSAEQSANAEPVKTPEKQVVPPAEKPNIEKFAELLPATLALNKVLEDRSETIESMTPTIKSYETALLRCDGNNQGKYEEQVIQVARLLGGAVLDILRIKALHEEATKSRLDVMKSKNDWETIVRAGELLGNDEEKLAGAREELAKDKARLEMLNNGCIQIYSGDLASKNLLKVKHVAGLDFIDAQESYEILRYKAIAISQVLPAVIRDEVKEIPNLEQATDK